MLLITRSGKQIDPSDVQPEDIDIQDIAGALANQCRFNGHSNQFYSVAEHSVRVAYMVPERDRLWGLLHDATEAYVGDVIAPVKALLPEFERLEARVMEAVKAAFGLKGNMPVSVKAADKAILSEEIAAFMPPVTAGKSWSALMPVEAQQIFMSEFHKLRRA